MLYFAYGWLLETSWDFQLVLVGVGTGEIFFMCFYCDKTNNYGHSYLFHRLLYVDIDLIVTNDLHTDGFLS